MIILLVLVLAFSLVACTNTKNPVNDEDVVDENNENEVVEPTPETKKEEVTLYFANKKYVETGDESHEELLPEKRVIEYKDISLEETIVRELIKGPKDDELSTVIPQSAKLLSVEVEDGTAFINFAQEGLNGGSMQENFTISQIVNSLIELDSVERVQFLIDGEKAETLMGHFEISEPFEE